MTVKKDQLCSNSLCGLVKSVATWRNQASQGFKQQLGVEYLCNNSYANRERAAPVTKMTCPLSVPSFLLTCAYRLLDEQHSIKAVPWRRIVTKRQIIIQKVRTVYVQLHVADEISEDDAVRQSDNKMHLGLNLGRRSSSLWFHELNLWLSLLQCISPPVPRTAVPRQYRRILSY